MWVAGVDGCPAGWAVVLVEEQGHQPRLPGAQLCTKFEEVLALFPALTVIAVDIPIGLLDQPQRGGRVCDQQARRLLGRPRRSSVFSPPSRSQFGAKNFDDVRGHGLTKQAYNILRKIVEVDNLLTPDLQNRVYESHPELAFWHLAAAPMRFKKKTIKGREERLRALERGSPNLDQNIRQRFSEDLEAVERKDVAPDDLLDAYALAWAALCIAERTAKRVPSNPPIDRRGLRMEIWY